MQSSRLEMLAHDLRAPLTALKIASSLLGAREAHAADPETAVLIAALERNLARLERIADELSAMASQEEVSSVGSKVEHRRPKGRIGARQRR